MTHGHAPGAPFPLSAAARRSGAGAAGARAGSRAGRRLLRWMAAAGLLVALNGLPPADTGAVLGAVRRGGGSGAPAPSPPPVNSIATGYFHSCAVVPGGTVLCWGSNGFGELGNGTFTDSPVPIPVSGITPAVAVTVGFNHGCALIAGGTVECWGYNAAGQLGDG